MPLEKWNTDKEKPYNKKQSNMTPVTKKILIYVKVLGIKNLRMTLWKLKNM